MCGRISVHIPAAKIKDLFHLEECPQVEDRFNITPSQLAAVVRNQGDHNRLDFLKWGLVPMWAKDSNIGSQLITARCESLLEKPAFRHAVKYRRCIIPASGFYEWERSGEHKKQPWYIRMTDESPLCLAGLWETWKMPGGNELETFAIVTTASNKLVAPLNDNMPLILHPDSFSLWLSHNMHDPEQLLPFYQPFPASAMTAYKVSDLVNNPHVDSPACIEKL